MKHHLSALLGACSAVAIAAALGCSSSGQPAASDAGTQTNSPTGAKYFLALHCEPYDSEAEVASPFAALESIVAMADGYGIRLTIMFGAVWGDYIGKDASRKKTVLGWGKKGHELSIHHHGVYHGTGWDGYTDISESERLSILTASGVSSPSALTYRGSLADFTTRVSQIGVMRSGCSNDDQDKRELLDAIVYDTCSGFANSGTPGSRNAGDSDVRTGINEFLLTANYRGIARKFLSHTVLKGRGAGGGVQETIRGMKSGVYGAVSHAKADDVPAITSFLEAMHQDDPTGQRSVTVSQAAESSGLAEHALADSALTVIYPPPK